MHHARDRAELLRFVEEVAGRMPGVMRTRTARVPWKLKDVYQWTVPRPLDEPHVGRWREG